MQTEHAPEPIPKHFPQQTFLPHLHTCYQLMATTSLTPSRPQSGKPSWFLCLSHTLHPIHQELCNWPLLLLTSTAVSEVHSLTEIMSAASSVVSPGLLVVHAAATGLLTPLLKNPTEPSHLTQRTASHSGHVLASGGSLNTPSTHAHS